MSIDNIVQISVDTFDPKDKPKTIYINLNTATLEELKPYIGIDERVRDAYGRKFIEEMNRKKDTK
jgi:hypothetical protein